MSQVSELLDRLADGRTTVGAVAADFLRRRWTAERAPTDDYAAEARHEFFDDPGLIPENSWLEVEAAYLSGKISESVYRLLWQAAFGRTRP